MEFSPLDSAVHNETNFSGNLDSGPPHVPTTRKGWVRVLGCCLPRAGFVIHQNSLNCQKYWNTLYVNWIRRLLMGSHVIWSMGRIITGHFCMALMNAQ